jgi:hypothetical protein
MTAVVAFDIVIVAARFPDISRYDVLSEVGGNIVVSFPSPAHRYQALN